MGRGPSNFYEADWFTVRLPPSLMTNATNLCQGLHQLLQILPFPTSSPPSKMTANQEAYATNLDSSFGVALLNPVRLRHHSGHVGDIAFFTRMEDMNGFEMPLMKRYPFPLIATVLNCTQGLDEWGWPLHVSEQNAITVETPPHFRIAIGGNVKLVKREAGIVAEAPIIATGYLYIVLNPYFCKGQCRWTGTCEA